MKSFIIFFAFYFVSCSNPAGFLNNEIKRLGYIPYTTPLKHAGTGTLVGGSPNSMSIVAHPDSCFPVVMENNQRLRRRDDTSLPTRNEHFHVNGDIVVDVMDAIGNAAPTIGTNFRFKEVQSMELEFKGVHIEYLDSISLVNYYRNEMSWACQEYLDRVGFIIQAITADEMRFRFYKKNGGRIYLDVRNIEEYLDISLDIQWEITQNTTFIIKTPKYIGYQLGSLKRSDNGLSLLRASKTSFNKWVFKEVSVFSLN